MTARYSEAHGAYLSQLSKQDVDECMHLAMMSGVAGQGSLDTKLDYGEQTLLHLLKRLDPALLEAGNQNLESTRPAFDAINSPSGAWMATAMFAFRLVLERMSTWPTHQEVSRALAPVSAFSDEKALAHVQLDILKHGAWGGVPMSKCGPQPDNYLRHWLSFFADDNGSAIRRGLENICVTFSAPRYLKYCFISMDIARRLTDQAYSTEFKETFGHLSDQECSTGLKGTFNHLPVLATFSSPTLTRHFRKMLQAAIQAGELHLTNEAKDMLDTTSLNTFKGDLMPLIEANAINRAAMDAAPSVGRVARATPRVRRNGI